LQLAARAPTLTTANTRRAAFFSLRTALKPLAKPAVTPPQLLPLPAADLDDEIEIHHGDCRELLPTLRREGDVIVTDVPYNRGIGYDGYDDSLSNDEYRDLISVACRPPSVIVGFPELMCRIAMILGMEPARMAAWGYHANLPRQWRAIGWFGVTPNFTLVRQPYRNPDDARIKELTANGSEGAALTDWWEIELVRNVSSEKVDHPCQTPIEVMRRIITVTPYARIVDPFAGTGSTLHAAEALGRPAIGIEQSEVYCKIARARR
jgi:DNA modification methylase